MHPDPIPARTAPADRHFATVAGELTVSPRQVAAAAALLAEGATVPFIARYRKEATGSLDEVALTAVRDRLEQLAELERRRASILKSLQDQGVITDALRSDVLAAATLTQLEDVYRPFKPKRRTRASMARERGLAPLAELLLAQDRATRPDQAAAAHVDPERGVDTVEDALRGARDIIAEIVSDDPETREELRRLYRNDGSLRSQVARGKEQDGAKFRDWFDWQEPAARAPSHRILALRRGEKEDVLRLSVEVPEERALAILRRRFVRNTTAAAGEVDLAVADGWRRLLSLSMETEIRLELKQRADREAIAVFAANLRELLLAAPLGQKRVLALDPGFRTGCKLVCLGAQGDLLHHDAIYPHTGGPRAQEAGTVVRALVKRFQVEAIAVGNGTAGRETEAWLSSLDLPTAVPVVMVNESGASIYSASEIARREFPDHDVTVRGAVSIGRRLQDPLSELVKLDPKTIGVGQYQHDVDQPALRRSLDDVVVSCVNAVGVDVNTASEALLTYVSGLGPQLAANIVARRTEQGPFEDRRSLLKVSRLGPKAFEQCAGFLRIPGAANPLDASAVHPESYPVVEAMARDLGRAVADLLRDDDLRNRIDLRRYRSDSVGLPTLVDIMRELARPGRDPRERFEPFAFAAGVGTLEDLEVGMRLPGIVTNVTDFGAFIDVGVHQDGLAHVSQLADRFVRHPSEVVKVQQRVLATVIGVDRQRGRISLSLKEPAEEPQ
ncbi:MAG: Tex family protein [Candidatus Krumholzibacteriia bacterium]